LEKKRTGKTRVTSRNANDPPPLHTHKGGFLGSTKSYFFSERRGEEKVIEGEGERERERDVAPDGCAVPPATRVGVIAITDTDTDTDKEREKKKFNGYSITITRQEEEKKYSDLSFPFSFSFSYSFSPRLRHRGKFARPPSSTAQIHKDPIRAVHGQSEVRQALFLQPHGDVCRVQRWWHGGTLREV
jgi:hypothetical protein